MMETTKFKQIFEITIEYDGTPYRDEFWMNVDNLRLVLTSEDYKLNTKLITNIRKIEYPPKICEAGSKGVPPL